MIDFPEQRPDSPWHSCLPNWVPLLPRTGAGIDLASTYVTLAVDREAPVATPRPGVSERRMGLFVARVDRPGVPQGEVAADVVNRDAVIVPPYPDIHPESALQDAAKAPLHIRSLRELLLAEAAESLTWAEWDMPVLEQLSPSLLSCCPSPDLARPSTREVYLGVGRMGVESSGEGSLLTAWREPSTRRLQSRLEELSLWSAK